MADFPTISDLLGHDFDDVDGAGFSHREWMANVGAQTIPGTWTRTDAGEVVATVDDPAKTPITIQATADQTAEILSLLSSAGQTFDATKLLAIHDDAGDVIADWDASGSIAMYPDVALSEPTRVFLNSFGALALNADSTKLGVGANQIETVTDGISTFRVRVPGTGTSVIVQSGVPTDVGLVLGTIAGQTADLQQWDDDLGDVASRVNAIGVFISRVHAEPADNDLNASEHVTWLDDTPGASVLHIKAKSSDGTVVTGSVPLA